jgi:hypothetical protein
MLTRLPLAYTYDVLNLLHFLYLREEKQNAYNFVLQVSDR